MAVYSYIGKGTIYLEDRATNLGLMPIGNCSQLQFAVEEEKKDLADYENAGGGKANSLSRITGVTSAITVHDLSPANLSIALRGSRTAVAAGAVSSEPHTAYKGALVPFTFMPDTALTITVTGPSATPTYTLGTDYIVARAGVIILAGGAIANAASIECTYTKLGSDVVQGLTDSAKEFKLVFDGLNEAASGKAVTVTTHRIKFSPTQGLDLIGDDFAGLQLAGEVLKDSAITGAGISQYFKTVLAA